MKQGLIAKETLMLEHSKAGKPVAVVLSASLTGLATVRSLAAGKVPVLAAVADWAQPAARSRLCRAHLRPADDHDDGSAVAWLVELCKRLESRPVVIPSSDADALWLAKHADLLRPHCRFSTTTHDDLMNIVSKDRLYAIAQAVGVPVVPAITEPAGEALTQWSLLHPGPYLLKPFYNRMPGTVLRQKNLLIERRDDMMTYVEKNGSLGLIVQRSLSGGDGFILDCYGLCGADGRPIAMASHRRIRQGPANFGTTSFGEIPALGDNAVEAKLFDYTARLLQGVNFHGIFGIEWLQDQTTRELYLIDFNARPFSSIGHLRDCGLNLPWLAYRELLGEDLSGVPQRPQLSHLYWMDALSDVFGCKTSGSTHWWAWLKSLSRCRSFAVWDWRDPMPWVSETTLALSRAVRNVRLRAVLHRHAEIPERSRHRVARPRDTPGPNKLNRPARTSGFSESITET